MPEHIRSLIVILGIAAFAFYLVRKHIEPLLEPGEFIRWRNAWFAFTAVAFLAGNFWLYIIASAAVVTYTLKSLDNRFALYMVLLFAVPLISARIPVLIDISSARMLALVILVPMLLSKKWRQNTPPLGSTLPDVLLILLVILMTLLEIRGRTFTDALRTGLGFGLDWFLPYFIASRAIKDMQQLRAVIIAFVMAALIAGMIATFEFVTRWLLYNALPGALNTHFGMGSYLGRGDQLRALSSLGHPLVLGFVMMISIGLYLYVGPFIQSKLMRRLGLLTLIAGVIAPFSRGPWVGTFIVAVIFIITGRKAIPRLAVMALIFAAMIPALPHLPGGEKIMRLIPGMGTSSDQFNVDYRSALFDKAILIVKRHPIAGVYSPKNEPEMEDMVQGEGIVDIVNMYLIVVLQYGTPGLLLFTGFFMSALLRTYKSRNKIKDRMSDDYRCGRSLLAVMIAALVTIFSISGIGILVPVLFLTAGLLFSYSRIINSQYKPKRYY